MANSSIKITFLQVPSVNYTINFTEALSYPNAHIENFKTVRLHSNQVKIPPEVEIVSEDGLLTSYEGTAAENFKTAFDLDYNGTNRYTVTISELVAGKGIVTIEANYANAVFSYTDDGLGVIDVDIDNAATVTPMEINSVVFSEADETPCLKVKVTATTSALATNILSPFVLEDNTNNPIVFEMDRDQLFNLTVHDVDDNTATRSVQLPSKLLSGNFSVGIVNSPSGSTITVSNVNTQGLDLEYSLDNSEWQSSNIYSGMESGAYTIYVRDQIGCSFEMNFTVSDNNINVPFFYISKSNGIRFAKRIAWGDAANYKTDENTLSCEVDVKLPYKQTQLFQSADVIITQFKSNYDTNTVHVVKEDLSEVSIPVLQKSNYIGIKDKRDARKYNLGGGKVGIYFTSGNKYDYNTNAVNGTHSLNGLLPEWGVVGNYLSIEGSWFLIEQIFFDDLKNSDVLVITETYAGPQINVITGCIYNIYDYEIFEFAIDMSAYIGQNIRVRLNFTDHNFPALVFLSEQINIDVRHKNTIDINYWNNDNNDVFYATGIRHRIRIPYTKVEGITDEESSIHKTDTNAILLSADLHEGDKIIFEPLTKEIWRKLMMALSHKNVYLDGCQYVKNGDFESEGPLEDTNLYILKVNMLKAGNVYNSNGSTFGAANSSSSDIPGFIEGNTGFIRY